MIGQTETAAPVSMMIAQKFLHCGGGRQVMAPTSYSIPNCDCDGCDGVPSRVVCCICCVGLQA
eukprot:1504072-Amphidinium_carterae.2